MRKAPKMLTLLGALVGCFLGCALWVAGDVHAETAPMSMSLSVSDDKADTIYPSRGQITTAHYQKTITVTMRGAGYYTLTAKAGTPGLTNEEPVYGRGNPSDYVTEIAAANGYKLNDDEHVNWWGATWGEVAAANDTLATSDDTTYTGISATGDGTKLFENKKVCPGNSCNVADTNVRYVKLDFGVRVNDMIAGGDYENAITVSAVASPQVVVTYVVNYDGNGDGVTNVPSAATYANRESDETTTHTMSSQVPTRFGYDFQGWSLNADGPANPAYAGNQNVNLGELADARGEYEFTFYAIWNRQTPFSIGYDANAGGASVSGVPNAISVPTSTTGSTTTYTLTAADLPTLTGRTGYTFRGWVQNASDKNNESATFLAAGNEVTVTSAGLTLYAVWHQDIAYATNAADPYKMQDMTGQLCAAAADGTTATLKDERDGYTYLTKKLADGNCWMVQNLAIQGGQTIKAWDSATGNTYDYAMPSSSTSGFNDNAKKFMYNGSHKNATVDSNYNGGNSGAYYSWRTAIAVNDGDTVSSTSGDNPTTSICPKGWVLPKSKTSENGTFQYLYSKYSSNRANFVAAGAWNPGLYTGVYSNGSLGNQTSNSYWWSSTVYDGNNAYDMDINSSNVNPNSGNNRYYGFSVRCVLMAE